MSAMTGLLHCSKRAALTSDIVPPSNSLRETGGRRAESHDLERVSHRIGYREACMSPQSSPKVRPQKRTLQSSRQSMADSLLRRCKPFVEMMLMDSTPPFTNANKKIVALEKSLHS